jgi:hypothetical protein
VSLNLGRGGALCRRPTNDGTRAFSQRLSFSLSPPQQAAMSPREVGHKDTAEDRITMAALTYDHAHSDTVTLPPIPYVDLVLKAYPVYESSLGAHFVYI